MRKLVSLLLVLIAVLVTTGIVSAQDALPVPCGSLAAADCSLLEQSRDAMAALNSADVSFKLVATAENIPNMPVAGPLTVAVSGDGSFAGDLSPYFTLPPQDVITNPNAYSDYLKQIVGGFNGDLQLKVALPQQLLAASSVPFPANIPINVRLVDGKAYLEFDALTKAFGEDAGLNLPKGWGGVDVVGLIDQGASALAGQGIDTGSVEIPSDLTNLEYFEQYLQVERLADEQIDGETVAVFQTTIDLQGLMNDLVVQQALDEAFETQNGLTDEQIAAVEKVFDGLTLVATQKVGLNDHFVRSSDVEFSFDMTEMMKLKDEATAEPTVAPNQPAPVLKMSFQTSLSGFNAGQTISAPNNVTMIPVGPASDDGGITDNGGKIDDGGIATDGAGRNTLLDLKSG